MTKEEIYAKLDVLNGLYENHYLNENIYQNNKQILEHALPFVKSIKDLQKEAFEAGRNNEHFEGPYKYETFEDYLNEI